MYKKRLVTTKKIQNDNHKKQRHKNATPRVTKKPGEELPNERK